MTAQDVHRIVGKTKPLEVVAVRPKLTGQKAVTSIITQLGNLAVLALYVMVLVPTAHKVLGTPHLHPGYWDCLTFAIFFQVALNTVKSASGSAGLPVAGAK